VRSIHTYWILQALLLVCCPALNAVADEPAEPAPAPAAGESSGPDAAEAEVTSVLVFGPGGSNTDGVVASGYVRERLPAKERPKERVSVTGIPFPTDRELWMTGAGKVAWCPAGMQAPESLDASLARAQAAMEMVEINTIVGIGDAFDRNAACFDQIVDAKKMAELALLRGLSHHVENQPELAHKMFVRAAGTYPELQWDVGYPPEPQQDYLTAREEIIKQAPAHFGWNLSLIGASEVYIDGIPVEPRTLVEIAPVPHLVQLKDSEGGVMSIVLDAKAGGRSVLVDRAGATAALMAGPDDPFNATVAATVLNAVANQWSAQRVVVVDTTYRKSAGEPLVYRFGTKDGMFETLTAMKTLRRHMPPFSDRVRIAVGGAVGAEVDSSGAGFHWVLNPGGNVAVRLGPGFTPNAGLALQTHRLEGSGGGQVWVITPLARGGLGYRWHPRSVQTYIGIDMLLRFNQSLAAQTAYDGPSVVTGLALCLNFDIVTPKVPGVFLRVGGSLGTIATDTFIEGGVKIGLSL